MQVATLSANWDRFAELVHFHHSNEDTLVFPWLATKVSPAVIQELSAEHEVLLGGRHMLQPLRADAPHARARCRSCWRRWTSACAASLR